MSASSRNEENVNASVSMPFDYDPTEERPGSSETLSELVGEDGHREYFDGTSQLESGLGPFNGSSNRSSHEENNLANNEWTSEERYAEIPGEFYESSQKLYYGETQGESYEEITGVDNQDFQRVTLGHSDAPALVSPVELGGLKLENASLSKRDVDTQLDFSDLDQTYGKLRGIIVNKHNVLWPTNSEFAVLNAEKKIEEYIQKCWKIQSSWCFHIQFLQSMPGCYRNKFIFQVIFSIPTKEKPVPSATVSVYFTFDVDVYGGKDETVKVHYVIEGNRFPHVPGTVPFSQKWLFGVLEQKKKIQSLVCSQVML